MQDAKTMETMWTKGRRMRSWGRWRLRDAGACGLEEVWTQVWTRRRREIWDVWARKLMDSETCGTQGLVDSGTYGLGDDVDFGKCGLEDVD